jgi:hypothetical protein
VREAAKWLQAAFDGGQGFARLRLAHLTLYAGQEGAALVGRCVGVVRWRADGGGGVLRMGPPHSNNLLGLTQKRHIRDSTYATSVSTLQVLAPIATSDSNT